MISMSWVGRPIRIRVVWGKDLQPAAGFGDAVQLSYKTKHIRNMLDDVATDDLFKFVVAERIGERTEIVNDVCMAARVCIDADRAGKLVLTAADIKNSFPCR